MIELSPGSFCFELLDQLKKIGRNLTVFHQVDATDGCLFSRLLTALLTAVAVRSLQDAVCTAGTAT